MLSGYVQDYSFLQYPTTDRGNEENQPSPPASLDGGDSHRTTPKTSCSHRSGASPDPTSPDGFALGRSWGSLQRRGDPLWSPVPFGGQGLVFLYNVSWLCIRMNAPPKTSPYITFDIKYAFCVESKKTCQLISLSVPQTCTYQSDLIV
jgi:hypothetical protein